MNKDVVNSIENIIKHNIYGSQKKRVFINLFTLAIILFLFCGDFTLKITANMITVIWIAMNSYLISRIITSKKKSYNFLLSSFTQKEKLKILYLINIKLSNLFYIVLFSQTLLLSKNVLIAFIYSFLQYNLAILLGITLAKLFKEFGAFLIGGLGIYNFIFYNPYTCKRTHEILSVSEPLYNTSMINILWIIQVLLVIATAVFIGRVDDNDRKLKIKNMSCLFLLFTLVFCSDISMNKITDKLNKKYSITHNVENKTLRIKGYKEDDIRILKEIILSSDREIEKYVGKNNLDIDNIEIHRQYKSIFTDFKPKYISPINIKNKTIKYIIVSNSLLNNKNGEMVYNNVEDIVNEIIYNIEGYGENIVTRHILEGYAEMIKIKVCEDSILKKTGAYKVAIKKSYEPMMEFPVNENNFIKRTGFLIINKYTNIYQKIYKEIRKNSIDSKEKFLIFLKEKYPDIYNDDYLKNYLETIKERF
ncbi:hypothetical protein FDB54_04705 [Clostridium botulinum]|nr:hypothetical protein [Clostridium botulinum]